MSTIYALSSSPGKAGIAVMRLSGDDAKNILQKITREKIPEIRRASLRALHHPTSGEKIDEALVLFFEAPHSFTGEDVVEFHVHGSVSVVRALSDAFSVLGCALAEPGAFTRRAFDNGKLDLAQIEGLADLIAAETESQRKQALRQMEGSLSRIVSAWRKKLLHLLAHSEADIDFPEEDLPKDILTARLHELRTLAAEIEAHLQDKNKGERLRTGFRIAILGAPNAGKSSLLNALAKREAAIVSAQAGTTRDVIEVHLDLGGYPVLIADTAGLRETSDEIEAEGMRRALHRAEDADLKLVLFDATQESDAASLAQVDGNSLVVFTKADLKGASSSHPSILLSAKTGEGLQTLLTSITAHLQQWFEKGATPLLTRERHREALTHTRDHILRAITAYETGKPGELTAEDLRLATRALGRITGEVDVEELLDVIFRDFCIGK
jgi:tRNA modification GTPase